MQSGPGDGPLPTVDDLQLLEVALPAAARCRHSRRESARGRQRVELAGAGFTPAATVHFGPNPVPEIVFLSPSALRARVPAASIALAGKLAALDVHVDLRIATGSSSDTLPNAYRYTPRAR